MRGRPKIDDVRDKLYRVRVNDEEEQMLGYICSAIGIKKSDVFRRALALYYQNVRLTNIRRMGMRKRAGQQTTFP